MILQKLHDARMALEKAEIVASAAQSISRALEARLVDINAEIAALSLYLETRKIKAEDLSLVALEIRRDTIVHSLGTLHERGDSFEVTRAAAQKVVDDLQAMMLRSLGEHPQVEPVPPAVDP